MRTHENTPDAISLNSVEQMRFLPILELVELDSPEPDYGRAQAMHLAMVRAEKAKRAGLSQDVPFTITLREAQDLHDVIVDRDIYHGFVIDAAKMRLSEVAWEKQLKPHDEAHPEIEESAHWFIDRMSMDDETRERAMLSLRATYKAVSRRATAHDMLAPVSEPKRFMRSGKRPGSTA